MELIPSLQHVSDVRDPGSKARSLPRSLLGLSPQNGTPQMGTFCSPAKKEAARTPGAVAGNELIPAEKQLDAAKSIVQSKKSAAKRFAAAKTKRCEVFRTG